MINPIFISSSVATRFGRMFTIKNAALAGITGPILFTLGIVLSDILNYSFLIATANDPFTTSPVSVNALGPYGWLQIATFTGFGLLLLVFAFGLHQRIQTNKWSRISTGLLVTVGITMLLMAAPCDCELNGQYPAATFTGTMHSLTFFGFMLVQIAMYFCMWWCLRQDARWKGCDRYSLATGILALPLFISLMSLPPTFAWFYLWLLLIPLAWIEITAIRLWVLSGD